MTLTAIAFVALLLACLADAYSTNALLDRGGYEKNLARIIGMYPDPLMVWLVVGIVPVIAGGLLLVWVPEAWWMLLFVAAWRTVQVYRNNRL